MGDRKRFEADSQDWALGAGMVSVVGSYALASVYDSWHWSWIASPLFDSVWVLLNVLVLIWLVVELWETIR